MAELTQFLEQPTSTAGVATQGIQALFPGLDIKIDDILDQLFPKDGNTSFEELECIGLNTNTDALVGIIRVKLPSGYSGGPCTAGSTEYVTFWADFNNNGTFETCLGTASVKVHDFDSIPKEGLEYAVFLPIDLTHRRQPCSEGPKVVRIRAILSWNAAPPCFNSNYIPIWGNREETLVHITPGPTIPVGEVIPKISVLGGIPVGKIANFTGLTTATAVFEANNLAPDTLGRPCPFGQWINVKGPQYFGYKYIVDVRELPSGAWTTLNTPLKVVDQDGNVNDQIPDGSGMFTYLPFTQNIGNLLALWLSTGDALWQVRLRIFELDGDPLPGADAHRIQLDNTWPDASVVIETGVGNCGKFNQGDPLAGHFVARDLYFGSYSLTVKPPINVPPIGVPVPSGAFVQTALLPGDPWSLDTSQMTPCGYIIEVVAVDRAILNSATVGHHTPGSAGFCIEKMA
jgi:hypothetical protein